MVARVGDIVKGIININYKAIVEVLVRFILKQLIKKMLCL